MNQSKIESWENSQLVAWIKSMPRYVKYGSMSGPLINDHDNAMDNPNYPPIGDYNNNRRDDDDNKGVHLDIYNTPEINFEDADSRKNSLQGGKNRNHYDH